MNKKQLLKSNISNSKNNCSKQKNNYNIIKERKSKKSRIETSQIFLKKFAIRFNQLDRFVLSHMEPIVELKTLYSEDTTNSIKKLIKTIHFFNCMYFILQILY
jgi:hypothetical protein